MKNRIISLFAAFAAIMLLGGCSADISNLSPTDDTGISHAAQAKVTHTRQTTVSEATTAPETVPKTVITKSPETLQTSVRIVCAGDNLIHSPIYRLAEKYAGSDGYDFLPMYEHIGTLISDADLAILNQETIITDDFPPSTWPFFCTPGQMARDMTALGFDAFSISNNHVLDQGEAGLISTLSFWKNNYPDIPVYGAYMNDEDMDNIRTLEVNGITFAFVGFTEHTNGLSLPSDSDCRIVYLSDEEKMEQQIRRADEISDCVIVSVHFGIEVSNTVTQQQYELSRRFAQWGADLIIGTQPHTVQSMEYIPKNDTDSAFVFYCLGNLISNMDIPEAMAEILGEITVTKDTGTGKITLSDACAVPLVNYYNPSYSEMGVYPLREYTPELASTHAVKGATYERMVRLFKDNIPREYIDSGYDFIYE